MPHTLSPLGCGHVDNATRARRTIAVTFLIVRSCSLTHAPAGTSCEARFVGDVPLAAPGAKGDSYSSPKEPREFRCNTTGKDPVACCRKMVVDRIIKSRWVAGVAHTTRRVEERNASRNN